jgi:hypothetical protein
VVRAALSALALLAVGLAAGAEDAPSLRREGDRLIVRALPDVLARPEVEEHLTTGLTTSFVVEVAVRDRAGAKAAGGALVEIRYEPWDEVFLATRADLAGPKEAERLASRRELSRWWRALELAVASTAPLSGAEPWQVKVTVSVVPFSSAEQRDAQRWFSRSLAPGERAAGRNPASEDPPPDASTVLNLLIATSIGRPSDLVFEWRLELAPGGRR